AVISSFEETPDPRVKFLMEELVKSLHDFVRRTDLSFDEWGYAIDFLTRVGQKCTPTRQEFIMLSDVFGVSMLVDAVNHCQRDGATETTVLGPFYVGEHKVMPHGADISPDQTGERMFVQGRVTDLSGKPMTTAGTIPRSRITRPKVLPRGDVSSPTPRAGFSSERSCLAAIRSRPTV